MVFCQTLNAAAVMCRNVIVHCYQYCAVNGVASIWCEGHKLSFPYVKIGERYPLPGPLEVKCSIVSWSLWQSPRPKKNINLVFLSVIERLSLPISHVFKVVENREPDIVGCYVQLRSELKNIVGSWGGTCPVFGDANACCVIPGHFKHKMA